MKRGVKNFVIMISGILILFALFLAYFSFTEVQYSPALKKSMQFKSQGFSKTSVTNFIQLTNPQITSIKTGEEAKSFYVQDLQKENSPAAKERLNFIYNNPDLFKDLTHIKEKSGETTVLLEDLNVLYSLEKRQGVIQVASLEQYEIVPSSIFRDRGKCQIRLGAIIILPFLYCEDVNNQCHDNWGPDTIWNAACKRNKFLRQCICTIGAAETTVQP